MKRLLVAALCAAGSLCVASVAQAEGFYVGGHLGFGHEKSEWTDLDGDWHTVFPAAVGSFTDDTVTYGVQAGYDFEFDTIVVGIVGDISGADFKSDFRNWGYNGGTSCGCVSIKDDGSYLASIRGRAGFDLGWLTPYVTAGIGFTDLKHTWTETNDPNDSWPAFGNSTGVVYGGGFEATPFDDKHWSVAVEGLYYDFGSEASQNVDGKRMDVDTRVTVARIDLNYHFGS